MIARVSGYLRAMVANASYRFPRLDGRETGRRLHQRAAFLLLINCHFYSWRASSSEITRIAQPQRDCHSQQCQVRIPCGHRFFHSLIIIPFIWA